MADKKIAKAETTLGTLIFIKSEHREIKVTKGRKLL